MEDGLRLFAGIVPTDGSVTRAVDLADRFVDAWTRVGMPLGSLSDVVVTPACGVAGASPQTARDLQRAAVDAATELAERAAA